MVNENTNSKPEVASEDSDVLGLLMRHLLPTPAVSTPILSDRELLVQRLLGTVYPVQPVVQERSSLTDIDILLQSMLPVGSVEEEKARPPADRRQCVFCVESQTMRPRGVVFWMSRFLSCHRDGGQIGRTMDLYCDRPRGGLTVIKRETSTDPGRGVGRPDQ